MRSIYLHLSALIILSLHACGQTHVALDQKLEGLLNHTVPEISVAEASKTSSAVFLDAREPEEFKVSHVSRAISVGYDHFQLSIIQDLPKTDTIIVYCSVGYRSEKVAEKLRAAGFTKVFNLYGGIFEWKNQGREVVDSKGQSTNRVHTYNKDWSRYLIRGEKVY